MGSCSKDLDKYGASKGQHFQWVKLKIQQIQTPEGAGKNIDLSQFWLVKWLCRETAFWEFITTGSHSHELGAAIYISCEALTFQVETSAWRAPDWHFLQTSERIKSKSSVGRGILPLGHLKFPRLNPVKWELRTNRVLEFGGIKYQFVMWGEEGKAFTWALGLYIVEREINKPGIPVKSHTYCQNTG